MQTQLIDILGGQQVFKQNVDSFLSLIEITQKGFPMSVAQRVQKKLSLSNKQFSQMLNSSDGSKVNLSYPPPKARKSSICPGSLQKALMCLKMRKT
jgi:hypothetical protein